MKIKKVVLFFILLISFYGYKVNDDNPVSLTGNTVNDFSLLNTDNRYVSLSDYSGAKGFIVVFTCNHCPFAKLYTQRLNDLNSKYKTLGVPLLAINPMDTLAYQEESFALMQNKAANENFNFPYLQDGEQSAGKNFGAAHTPQAFVLWKENDKWIIKYSGAIDDNGQNPEKAVSFVSAALDELLESKPVSIPQTQSFGCKIYYRK
jgi:peroxiredoxin